MPEMAVKLARTPRIYPVTEIFEVHDGDTVRVRIDLGFNMITRQWIRLKDVWAPELSQLGGHAAKDFLIQTLLDHTEGNYVSLTTFWTQGVAKEIKEEMTFVRYVGEIDLPDGINLNAYMRGYLEEDA